ncbi:hypothetical protein SPI_00348 [Niveomyces insectorum RCEF 264]|uniref:CCZ1/INTU/HSP4 first Longin domain-containing protein n=1 Tax=Niveomyces insectorum RCEF 264 TaxID=1081102 RepID=A0A168A290_9HYPO|nr:hypothetical protein SPI_00348 [Niveomyces insectorum RCEF 264]
MAQPAATAGVHVGAGTVAGNSTSATTTATATAAAAAVVPAQLGFLAIYNPSLGTTDETVEDQIVYYASSSSAAFLPGGGGKPSREQSQSQQQHRRLRRSSAAAAAVPTSHLEPGERNERLRQIGLAQGMVAFGKSFSGDQAVDTIDTDKTRVVLHELEPDWWILASIDLTRLPLPAHADGAPSTEYSSREVKPAALLLQDLLRAHAVFLLHHDVSLARLFSRVTPRSRFTLLLARYWDLFLSSWSVLLHGNPVRDVLPGVRLAACGELGIGVGEEDRGSSERAVLEGLVEQTPGLVDLVVCKFGGAKADNDDDKDNDDGNGAGGGDDNDGDGGSESDDDDDDDDSNAENAWLGTGSVLGAEDGAVFLGVGALSRTALRTVTYWMEDIYSWGQDAYGVADNPAAPSRQAKRRKKPHTAMSGVSEQRHRQKQEQQQQKQQEETEQPPPQPQTQTQQQVTEPPLSLLPPPPVTELARRAKRSQTPTASPIPTKQQTATDETAAAAAAASLAGSAGSSTMDKYMSYMKLGYGTYWGVGGGSGDGDDDAHHGSSTKSNDTGTTAERGKPKHTDDGRNKNKNRPARKPKSGGSTGRFVLGLVDEPPDEGEATGKQPAKADGRTKPQVPRTVVVEVTKDATNGLSSQRASHNDGVHRDALPTNTDGKGQEGKPNHGQVHSERLRVVVYAQQPFLFTFLVRLSRNAPFPADGSPPEADADTAKPDALDDEAHDQAVQTLLRRQLSVLHRFLLRSTAYRPDRPRAAGATAAAPSLSSSSSPPLPPPSSSSSSANTAAAASAAASGRIYDLVWDPRALTIHSTIPNIPDPWTTSMAGTSKNKHKKLPPSPLVAPWSRVEALNTHMQLLHLYAATRANAAERERMCKTSRGWWIVWNRIVERSSSSPPPARQAVYGSILVEEDEEDEDEHKAEDASSDSGSQRAPSDQSEDTVTAAAAAAQDTYSVTKEIFLLRRASDHVDNKHKSSNSSTSRSSSGMHNVGGRTSVAMRVFSASTYLGRGGGGAGPETADEGGERGIGWADGASRLAQGIGVDTKKYIEGLLSLNR